MTAEHKTEMLALAERCRRASLMKVGIHPRIVLKNAAWAIRELVCYAEAADEEARRLNDANTKLIHENESLRD